MTDDLIDTHPSPGHAPDACLPRSDRARFATALTAATLLHIGVVVALVGWVEPDLAGASGADAAAASIEVTLVSARALESRTSSPTDAAAAAFAAVDGSVADTLDGSKVVPTEAPSAVAEEATTELAAQRGKPLRPSEVLTRLDAHTHETQPPDTAPRQTGGTAARSADRAVQPVAGAAAASPGVAVAYARAVAHALGHSRPKAHASVSGTVRIRFAIDDTGSVDDIVLERSSGRTALDTVAIEAVRRTRFPAPPSGLTSAQRTFEIPYHFR